MNYPIPRKHQRITFDALPFIFALQEKGAENIIPSPHTSKSAQKPLRLEGKNLSLGGMKFLSNQRIPLFKEVQIILFHKETGTLIAPLMGKVVRLEETDTGTGEKIYGIALSFQPFDHANLQKIAPGLI